MAWLAGRPQRLLQAEGAHVLGGEWGGARRAGGQGGTQQGAGCLRVDARRTGRQRRAVRMQRRRRQEAVAVGQVKDAGIGIGRRQRFAEQARQQPVEIVFGGDRHADVEEAPDRPFHAVHGHRQIIDFEDHRFDLDRLRELEAADRLRLAGQLAQGSGNAVRQAPGDRDCQQDHQDRRDQRMAHQPMCIGHQLVVGNRGDQKQRCRAFEFDRADRGMPGSAVDLKLEVAAAASSKPATGRQLGQYRDAEICNIGENGFARRAAGNLTAFAKSS